MDILKKYPQSFKQCHHKIKQNAEKGHLYEAYDQPHAYFTLY